MGTRHLIAVYKDGAAKVAQYGQWDGYPSGQGTDVLKFVSDPANVEALRAAVDNVHFITEEEYDAINAQVGIDPKATLITMEQADARKAAAPALSRDTSADILSMIAAGEVTAVQNAEDFAQDSLFCEYAYAVDLDTNRLEAYVGFQHAEHSDGRYAAPKPADFEPRYEGDSWYAPVRLAASWPLSELPSQEDFEATIAGVEKGWQDPEDQDDDEDEVVALAGPVIK